ncbi:choice-of-anchor H family protein [Alteromonas sp. 14N.309.X.WAT.G.H12]|uniref:choice-of-anchor H family protein n=1 Tax=Alteromonas sp. 14N.309.X.WAT.G.H12 TaxID=3120824 RepID=UPI002FD6F754
MHNSPVKPVKFLLPLFVAGILATPFATLADDAEKITDAREFQFGQAYAADESSTTVAETPRLAAKSTPKPKVAANSVTTADFWIYDAWTQWQTDRDYDGYYTSVTVTFDADTIYAQSPVYAVLYLGDAEAFYPIHTSSDFYIYGESSQDEFVIETDLVSGFPPYDYDVLIELYDSQTGELLAFANQNNDADLSYIPLESADYDDNTGGGSVVVVTEHGGTFSGTLLAIMGVIGLWRIIRAKY